MAYQQVSLELVRDGQCTPWGFRMTGGADIGTPLVIQKITFGSPSEGELQKGDIILRIRDTDASRLSHQAATDLILKTGSTLKLIVARHVSNIPGGVPVPNYVGTPLRPLLTPAPSDQSLFKPLPTTNFGSPQQRRMSTESYTSTCSETEKEAIVNQPYRSTPLILPSAKPAKDTPIGSYLRYDPLTRTTTPPLVQRDPFMLTKVQEAILEAAQSSSSGFSSPGRTPTPDMGYQNGPQIALKQYNSPINMYCNQAIVEALAAQTVGLKKPVPDQAELLETKKLNNIKDSPTYQLIHDEEWKKGKVEEYQPLQEHIYNVIPGSENYKSDIHQSDSFKTIMHNLQRMPEH
ncbi:PDZ and LIM domain protein 3-like [Uloborus diversus]|uniref:PDZ and LIM domain protein 3-like n=1 Tax=Uloborus diversus TaxID=327109 RepID=UPI00240A68A7|nr:PDZ and LIM domain protein 3-like [Uloborus diversus]